MAQHQGEELVGEVGNHTLESELDAEHAVPDRPVHERRVSRAAALGLIALERGGGEIHQRQNVAQSRRQLFLALERPTHAAHRNIGDEGEGGREAGQLLVITARLACHALRYLDEMRAGQPHHDRTPGIADRETDVIPQHEVEGVLIVALRRVHFGEHEGVAANGALTEQDQAAGEDVRPLDRNADGNLLIGTTEEVLRPEADPLASDHVHAVVDDLARTLGDVIFDDGRHHRRLLAQIDRTRRHHARGVAQVGVAPNARQGLFHTFEATDRSAELVTHAGVGPHRTRSHLLHADVGARQRDRAPGRETLHQHAPALARHLRPADDELERHEHVRAAHRTVHPHRVERHVATTDLDAGVVVRHQGAGDADILFATQQAVRVIHPESQPEHGAHRRQGDVALVETDAHAQHFLLIPDALAHHAGIRNRRRVRARPRTGQRKRGDLSPTGQAGQIALLLLGRAVVQQQLGRTKRIGHHDGDRGGGRARRQLGDHL